MVEEFGEPFSDGPPAFGTVEARHRVRPWMNMEPSGRVVPVPYQRDRCMPGSEPSC